MCKYSEEAQPRAELGRESGLLPIDPSSAWQPARDAAEYQPTGSGQNVGGLANIEENDLESLTLPQYQPDIRCQRRGPNHSIDLGILTHHAVNDDKFLDYPNSAPPHPAPPHSAPPYLSSQYSPSPYPGPPYSGRHYPTLLYPAPILSDQPYSSPGFDFVPFPPLQSSATDQIVNPSVAEGVLPNEANGLQLASILALGPAGVYDDGQAATGISSQMNGHDLLGSMLEDGDVPVSASMRGTNERLDNSYHSGGASFQMDSLIGAQISQYPPVYDHSTPRTENALLSTDQIMKRNHNLEQRRVFGCPDCPANDGQKIWRSSKAEMETHMRYYHRQTSPVPLEWFVCQWPDCPFLGGRNDVNRHEDTPHTRDEAGRRQCLYPGCGQLSDGRDASDRHYIKTHRDPKRKTYECKDENCRRNGDDAFRRIDHYNDHRKRVHGIGHSSRRAARKSAHKYGGGGGGARKRQGDGDPCGQYRVGRRTLKAAAASKRRDSKSILGNAADADLPIIPKHQDDSGDDNCDMKLDFATPPSDD